MTYKIRLTMLIWMANTISIAAQAQEFSFSDTLFSPGQKLTTYSVNFELARPEILESSTPFLDSLFQFLNQHDSLNIELGMHCDERYSNMSSTCLTCRRAKAITDLLIQRGIDPERLLPKGYNDTEPLFFQAKTEEEHQKNRRLVLTILSANWSEED
ncbi:OmpA family protein [bacterium SCSIO 12741]|nr:OmpA family protein [bacterium SCSIO 12741]